MYHAIQHASIKHTQKKNKELSTLHRQPLGSDIYKLPDLYILLQKNERFAQQIKTIDSTTTSTCVSTHLCNANSLAH